MMSETEDVRKPLLQAIAAKAGSTNRVICSHIVHVRLHLNTFRTWQGPSDFYNYLRFNQN